MVATHVTLYGGAYTIVALTPWRMVVEQDAPMVPGTWVVPTPRTLALAQSGARDVI